MKKLYLTSGLPRSGSTLLQNILAQNPRFHATPTSGLADVIFNTRNHWHTLQEHKANPSPSKLKNCMRGILENYHADIAKPVVFDKSRSWLAYIELAEHILGEKVKVLVPIRPIPDILSSFEKLYRETAKVRQPPGEQKNYIQFQTIKGRCDYWMQNDQVVGIALNRVQDAVMRGLKDRLFFVDFNLLTSSPKEMMKQIYEFLGEEAFEHDFDNVEQVTHEDDEIYGFVNLHKIKTKVQPVQSDAVEILGKEIVDNLKK